MASTGTGDRAAAVQRAYEDLNRVGIRAAAETLWAPDLVFVDIADLPGGGEHHGREAAIRHLDRFFDAWRSGKFEVRQTLEMGDRVAVCIAVSATGRSSGVAAEWENWHVGTFRGDQIVRVEAYSLEEDALAALRRPAD